MVVGVVVGIIGVAVVGVSDAVVGIAVSSCSLLLLIAAFVVAVIVDRASGPRFDPSFFLFFLSCHRLCCSTAFADPPPFLLHRLCCYTC